MAIDTLFLEDWLDVLVIVDFQVGLPGTPAADRAAGRFVPSDRSLA
jgi:hypothetical protein